MSTFLSSSDPKHKSGPFTAFTATSKYLDTSGRNTRVTVDGDPFFRNLISLRMAINRLSSQRYPFLLNTHTSIIEAGYHTKEAHFRPLTPDDFIIEAHLYTPRTIHIINHAYAGKTTPAEALGIQEPRP